METSINFKTQIKVLDIRKYGDVYTATIECAETNEIFKGTYYSDGNETDWEARQNAVRDAIWLMFANNLGHDIHDHEHPAIYDLF